MMRIRKKIIAFMLIFLPILATLGTQLPPVGAQPPIANLTGNIEDRGVDRDGDGKFDLLEIGVEINVTEPAEYQVQVSDLVSNDSRRLWHGWSQSAHLDPGIRRINISIYGPQIYDQRINPENVSSITLYGIEYRSPSYEIHYWIGSKYDIPLSGGRGPGGIYLYTEFDSPFADAEARFVVYPDGTVKVAGALDYTDIVPLNEGPTMEGVIGITENGGLVVASADYTLEMPPTQASEFPYNSTTVSLFETYSEGNVQSELNAASSLPPSIATQYPFNATDVTVTGTYSNGIFNVQLDLLTVLPPYVTSQFPFDTVDISAVGEYSNNVAEGTITFHMMPGFPLGDINIDFYGNETDLKLTSDITFIYDIPLPFRLAPPFPQFPLNRTTLDEWLLQINSTITGTGTGSLYNMTMGLFECTQFVTTPTYRTGSADVTFNAAVHGNFLEALAFIMSATSGAQNKLLYPLLNATLSSVDSLSFEAAYVLSAKQISTSLTLAYDMRSLVDYLAAPEVRYFTIASSSMYPTLMLGDIVRVENVADPSQIVANAETGDIIAFYHPSDPSVIVIHRAVDKFFNATTSTWYFTTKGDNNYYRDPWLVSDVLLIGKVETRIPYIGYYLLYPPGYPYYSIQLLSEIPPQLFNLTFSMLTSASMNFEYSSTNKEFQANLTATANLLEYRDDIAALLPDMAPSEIKPYVELLLNTTYCQIDSYNERISYQNGVASFESSYTIAGDLTAELNHLKEVSIEILKTMAGVDPQFWQLVFLNQTTIDINNLQASFNYGNTSLTVNLDGLTFAPPTDPVDSDPTKFKLYRFFNLTADLLFPSSNQRLKLTVEGGNNVTHAVTLIATGSVPTPNETSPDNSYMTWYNQSINNIKDLTFTIEPQAHTARVLVIDQAGDPIQNAAVEVYLPNGTLYKSLTTNDFGYTTSFSVDYEYMPFGEYNFTAAYQGVSATKSLIIGYSGVYTLNLSLKGSQKAGTITNPESVTATTPFIINATEKTSSELVITKINKPVEIVVRNITALPEGVEPPPGTFKALGNYVEIIANETDVSVNATIRIYYTLERLSELGLDESSLQIHYWDTAEGRWVSVESHINTDEQCVWAVVNHFSVWALFGQPSPFWTQIWFLALIVAIIVVVVAVGVVFGMRKKKAPPKETEQ